MKTQTLEGARKVLQSDSGMKPIYDNLTTDEKRIVEIFVVYVFREGQQQKAEEIIEQITWITPKTHLNCTLQSKLPYAKNVCSCGAREFNNGIQKVLERVKELSPAPLSVEKEI